VRRFRTRAAFSFDTIVERADRLARDLIVGELILNQLRELGVKVIAADSGTELAAGDDDPTRTLIRLEIVQTFLESFRVLFHAALDVLFRGNDHGTMIGIFIGRLNLYKGSSGNRVGEC